MRLIPFDPAHLFAFEAQAPQKPGVQWHTPEIAEAAALHFSWTGIASDGEIVGCAGIAPYDHGLVAWAQFSERLFEHRLAVTRAVKNGLALHSASRVEAHIDPEHAKAARFAGALNFRFEQVRCDLRPDGAPMLVYVREGA